MVNGQPTAIRPAKQQYAVPSNSLVRIILFAFSQTSRTLAIPVSQYLGLETADKTELQKETRLWLYLFIAATLVLLGGVFAGLTIALMGQDGVYLQVIATSDDGKEQRHAESVYNLLQKGKHWVLVTLLLSNVIVNESLPIVLDRSLGGGWPAVLGSTVLIVIFGEVIPQSVCVRYGLSIGAYMAPFVLTLMWILAPIAWPIAKLLDIMLGKDHGTVYKKSGLKTLVTLHKTLGSSPTERLNQDEVTIISAVLDLKDKAVGDIMTPIDDVFTMSEDTILNEDTMNKILSAGYSRIPIYEPGNPHNFVGMLLVKILITYDPEDCKRVSEFALATLPETRPETSCLDIVNFFQEGKSHMVLVSEFPAENYGAIGVVTLEDVIEELIGEEIIDESDVYIDVHKAIRRLAPAPKARAQNRHIVSNYDHGVKDVSKPNLIHLEESKENLLPLLPSGAPSNEISTVSIHEENDPKISLLRRSSGGPEGTNNINFRGNSSNMREHLKYLGPSNLASCPKSTRYSTVKIKSAHPQVRINPKTENSTHSISIGGPNYVTVVGETSFCNPQTDKNSPTLIKDKKCAIINHILNGTTSNQSLLQQGYGSFDNFKLPSESNITADNSAGKTMKTNNVTKSKPSHIRSTSERISVKSSVSYETVTSKSTGGSPARASRRRKRTVQSGSITQNIIETGGIQKLVIETNSSGDDIDQIIRSMSSKHSLDGSTDGNENDDTRNGDYKVPYSTKNDAGKKEQRKSQEE